MKISVVGSINKDMTVTAERIPLNGETLLGKSISYISGGKGANQAVAMARLGAQGGMPYYNEVMNETQIQVLPELNFDNLQEIMDERLKLSQNKETTIPMLWQGLLEMKILTRNQERTAKIYIPKNCPQGTLFVLLNVPEGEETLSFLNNSGWLEKCEREQLCLFVAEPGQNGWGTIEEEEDYFKACYEAEKQGIYFRAGLCMYVVGYGRIGVCLHNLVIRNPLSFAAAVFLDADEVDQTLLGEYQDKLYGDAQRSYEVRYGEIPVPIWLLSRSIAKNTDVIEYWKKAGSAVQETEDEIYGAVYMQESETTFTPEGKIVKVAVKEEEADYINPGMTENIMKFLLQFFRSDANGPGSNRITLKVNYDHMGVELKKFTDSKGVDRECLVYIPEAYRESKKKIPLVFAIHGISESMRNYFEASLWYRKAEKEGFMVVFPEGALIELPSMVNGGIAKANRPGWLALDPDKREWDLAYINELLNRLIDEYPVDETKIFCTGHSMGCMMTNYLSTSKIGEKFAAFGATSGIMLAQGNEKTKTPIFLTVGEYDFWDYAITSKGTLISKMDDRGALMNTIDNWLIRNELAAEETVYQIRTSNETEQLVNGNFHHYIWKNKSGIPLIRYTWVRRKEHMNTPEENFLLWDQWFNKWQKDEAGVRFYEGEAI